MAEAQTNALYERLRKSMYDNAMAAVKVYKAALDGIQAAYKDADSSDSVTKLRELIQDANRPL